MNSLEIREQEIFKTLKEIKNCEFVLIGGYAVNVYTLPRFSTDCDVVVKDSAGAKKIITILKQIGYKKVENPKIPYTGDYIRYEKDLGINYDVSIDIMIGAVTGRRTGESLSAEWIFEHSIIKSLKGKTFNAGVDLNAPIPECLIILKLMACRNTDIRDIFMLIEHAKDFDLIREEVSKHVNFREYYEKLRDKIISDSFRNDLQGVFGFIPEKIFERNKKLILKLGEERK